MSWLRAACARPGPGGSADADVFDDEADETLPAQREWRNRLERRVREGYTDGVEAGKAAVLQQGFNQGYREGAEAIVRYGQLRGTLSALLCWCRLQDRASPGIAPISDLLDAVGPCEEAELRRLAAGPLQPHVGDLLDSIQDMDLCPSGPAGEAGEAGLGRPGAELSRGGPRPAKPDFAWILEQTASVVERLGLPASILQSLGPPEN